MKLPIVYELDSRDEVTLHVRVWIEINKQSAVCPIAASHPPREGVD